MGEDNFCWAKAYTYLRFATILCSGQWGRCLPCDLPSRDGWFLTKIMISCLLCSALKCLVVSWCGMSQLLVAGGGISGT